MYRGRPHSDAYPPPSRGLRPRAPPPGSGHPFTPRGPFREERGRGRNGYPHGHSDQYRRSPPRRRYPSPDSGSGRGSREEFWGGGPPPREYDQRFTPSPPRGGIPTDHNLVITVGNELTSSQERAGPPCPEHPYYVILPDQVKQFFNMKKANLTFRDYHAGDSLYKPSYSSRKGSYDGPEDRHPKGRSLSRGRSRTPDRMRGRSRTPDRMRGRSRGRSRSRSRSRTRAVSRSSAASRARSKSRPRSRNRSRSRAGSRSRSRGRTRSRSRSRNRSRSRGRTRSRSRGRTRSRSRAGSRSRSRGRSRGRSRARSRARSKSRPHSRSWSRSRSQSRGRNRRRNTSDSSQGKSPSDEEGFRELEKARRRRELEAMLTMPTKSILKRRLNSETDSPIIVQTSNSPGEGPAVDQDSSGLSHEAERLLSAMTKGMEPGLLASVLGQLAGEAQTSSSDPFERLLSRIQSVREGGDGLNQILGVMAEVVAQPVEKNKSYPDIEDEEKFLYGDEDEEKPPAAICSSGAAQQSLPDIYGEDREDVAHYEDLPRKPYGATAVLSSCMQGHTGEGRGNLVHGSPQRDSRYPLAVLGQDESASCDMSGGGTQVIKTQQEAEEYEKIQELLKTIGLDLGVAEITKMAARTQERLHGKKTEKKPPKSRQVDRPHRSHSRSGSSSSSSNSRSSSRTSSRSSSGSRSRSSSRSRSRGRRYSKDSSLSHSKRSADQRSSHAEYYSQKEGGASSKTGESQRAVAVQPKTGPHAEVTHPSLSAHPALGIPDYSQPPAQVMANYPPPGYGPYAGYMPYMSQRWPMYPPPGMAMPPPGSMDDYIAPTVDRPYLKVIETVSADVKGIDKKASKMESVERDDSRGSSSYQRRIFEEKNNESEKRKVMEELEKLKRDRAARLQRKETLLMEVEKLRKQQGELLRRKRREKDGHKDPLLVQLGQLQEEVMAQISTLRAEQEAAERKQEELNKVAAILGIGRQDSRSSGEQEHHTSPGKAQKQAQKQAQKLVQKEARSPDKTTPTLTTKATTSKYKDYSEKQKLVSPVHDQGPDAWVEVFEYYDAGNHWCKNCNITSGSMFDYFTHLQSKSHRKTQDPYDRPWAPKSNKKKKQTSEEKISKPAKGSEFLLPVRGFYCLLCKEFFGDPICAEDHVTCHAHNEKYKEQMNENPLYEQRRNLDRQAGMESSERKSDNKRKHKEEDTWEDQKKTTYSKEEIKKPKNDSDDETKSKHRKEEEPRAKYGKEEEPRAKYGKEEEPRAKYGKEEEPRVKYGKEEEPRAKYGKEEEPRDKYGKEEEPRAKYGKEEEERPKYKREDEERTKYRKEEEERNKYRKADEERYRHRDGDRPKYSEEEERGRYKKEEVERLKYRGEEEAAKYLREDDRRSKYSREVEGDKRSKYKKNEEVKWPKSKWEKEEEDEQSTFRKRDYRSHYQKEKMAVRPKEEKEKSAKVSSRDAKAEPEKPSVPPKILSGPSPAMLAKLRRKNEEATGRPAFGKFSWKKPEKTELEKEAERMAAQFIREEEEIHKEEEENNGEGDQTAFAQSVAAAKSIAIKLSGKTVIPPTSKWVPYKPVSSNTHPNLPAPAGMVLRKSNTGLANKPSPLNKFAAAKPKAAADNQSPLPVSQTEKDAVLSPDIILKAFEGQEVQLKTPDDAPVNTTITISPGAPPQSLSSTAEPMDIDCSPPPSECVITLESDVAAPGVPESEQNLTVVVRPPPHLQKPGSEPLPKTDKPKSSLATAKAKDLFDIFYCGGSALVSTCSSADSVAGKKRSKYTEAKKLTSNAMGTKTNEGNGSNVEKTGSKVATTSKVEETVSKVEETSSKAEETMANLPVIESKDTQETKGNEEQMDSQDIEDAVSFSPPPGFFTEEINLDTFEFNFESL